MPNPRDGAPVASFRHLERMAAFRSFAAPASKKDGIGLNLWAARVKLRRWRWRRVPKRPMRVNLMFSS